jgi:Ca2+-binding EF-hand superfamily protein
MSCSDRKCTTLVATLAGCLAVAGTAFAQMQPATPAHPATPAQSTTPSHSSPATKMPSVTPNKAETASSAFEKLDTSRLGYVTKDEAAKLDGFDKVFTQADKNKDGKLSQDEFKVAWAIYTGNPQG